jgi:hypothetical protein
VQLQVLPTQVAGVVQSSAPLQPQAPLMQSLFCERTVQSMQALPQWAASESVQAVQAWTLHHWPDGQVPLQYPPQPSLAPPHFPEQSGVQLQLLLTQVAGAVQSSLPLQPQEPLMQSLFCERTVQSVQALPQWAASVSVQAVQAWTLHHWPDGQVPLQYPPQPSLAPPHFPVQLGVQLQLLPTQVDGAVQSSLPLQPQAPLMQSLFCERIVQSVQALPQWAAVLQFEQVPLLHH